MTATRCARRPVYLIAGHGRRGRGPDPILAHVFNQTGKSRPTIAYVGAASNDNFLFFRWIRSWFQKSGAGDVLLARLASPRADIGKARGIIAQSDLVFISGGDVEAGMAILAQYDLTSWFQQLFDQGKAFFGMSAGSIMLCRSWVRWRDPNDDASAQIFPCLGVAPVLCDTHAEADEWQELQTLLKLNGRAIGFGIPSGATLQVNGDGSVSALAKPVARFEAFADRISRLTDLIPR